jgi:hypothetical protein
MAQEAECLPSKHKALSSNPSTATPPKKKITHDTMFSYLLFFAFIVVVLMT